MGKLFALVAFVAACDSSGTSVALPDLGAVDMQHGELLRITDMVVSTPADLAHSAPLDFAVAPAPDMAPVACGGANQPCCAFPQNPCADIRQTICDAHSHLCEPCGLTDQDCCQLAPQCSQGTCHYDQSLDEHVCF